MNGGVVVVTLLVGVDVIQLKATTSWPTHLQEIINSVSRCLFYVAQECCRTLLTNANTTYTPIHALINVIHTSVNRATDSVSREWMADCVNYPYHKKLTIQRTKMHWRRNLGTGNTALKKSSFSEELFPFVDY